MTQRGFKADKEAILGNPDGPVNQKYNKMWSKKTRATENEFNNAETTMGRTGHFREGLNLFKTAQAKSNIRTDAMFNPKFEKMADKAYNPGPKSGFLSKAKNK